MIKDPGTLWRYVWENNPLTYFNLVMNTIGVIASIAFGSEFGMIFFGVLLFLSIVLAFMGWVIWREETAIYNEIKEILDEHSNL